MANKQLQSRNFINSTSTNSAPAWRAIIGLFLIIVLCLIGAAPVLFLVFPLGSFAVGIFLYLRYPVLYIGFTWWMWFLTPLIRRLIDFRCGYVTPFPVELTSISITSISLATLVKYLPRTYNRDGLPFILSILAILYGCLMGLIQQPITEPERQIVILLSWLSPVGFGFHLFINWRDYPSCKQNIQRIFIWIVLVTGIYGIFQFLIAPEWDTFYLTQNDLIHLGTPDPLKIRVFSTMTESVPFAAMLMPGLILLLINKEKWRLIAASFGYLTFLLSQARTPWYTFVIALVLLIFSLKGNHQIRMIIGIALTILVIMPLTTVEPFSEQITSRIESFSDLESDRSFRVRMDRVQRSMDYVSTQFIGSGLLSPDMTSIEGIGGSSLASKYFSFNDFGYLTLLVSLGWFGSITYLSGLVLLFLKAFQTHPYRIDIFAICSRAIALASVLRFMTANITTGAYAMPIWGFLGIAIAACKYYKYQYFQKIKTNKT